VFAALKIIMTILVTCASVTAAIVQSGRPLLVTCVSAAFLAGIFAAEGFRVYRRHSVRSQIY